MKSLGFRLFALFSMSAGSLLAADALADALAGGKFSLNARLRYEGVEQTGLRDAAAVTLRTRLGFSTADWRGFKATIEGENIVAADGDAYNQSGLNPGGADRAVVADPETTELNQLFLAYTAGKTAATLGRQRLVLDNARFVGDVGWRQNMQTFDAVVVQDKSLGHTTLTYGYLDHVNRVFGDRHAQGRWQSDSHVLNANYTGLAAGALTAYAYLLDFKNAASSSCATYGASFAGTQPIQADLKLAYRAEYAIQSDYGASKLTYTAAYAALSAGFVAKPGSLTLGYERLGSDHNVGFKTPLATLHAFNGWADLFLATPAAGLCETYLKATANLPSAVALTLSYHHFETDVASVELGNEVDLQLSRKFGKSFTGLVKLADFRRDSLAYPNVRKIWAQVEFSF